MICNDLTSSINFYNLNYLKTHILHQVELTSNQPLLVLGLWVNWSVPSWASSSESGDCGFWFLTCWRSIRWLRREALMLSCLYPVQWSFTWWDFKFNKTSFWEAKAWTLEADDDCVLNCSSYRRKKLNLQNWSVTILSVL